MIQPRQAHHGGVRVPALLQRPFDGGRVLVGQYLQVAFARDREDRAAHLRQRGRRVVEHEVPHPGRRGLLHERRQGFLRAGRLDRLQALDDARRRLFLAQDREDLTLDGRVGGDRIVGRAARLHDGRGLREQDVVAGDARPCEHDHEGDLRVRGSQHRRNDPAFAVADEPDARRVDVRPRGERLPGGPRVAGEILARRRHEISGRLANAAVVVAHHRDAVAREVVGEDEERLVPEDLLVAILRSAARDQDDRWKRTLPFRQSQRAVEDGLSRRVGDGDVFRSIGERRLRLLGTGWPRELLDLLQDEGQRTALCPGAGDLGAGAVQSALERPVCLSKRKREDAVREPDVAEPQTVGPLVGAVHRRRERAVRLRGDGHADAELHRPGGDGPLPRAGHRRRGCLGECERRNQGESERRDGVAHVYRLALISSVAPSP